MVLWLGLWAFKAKGVSLIPDYGTMIPQAAPPEEKKEEREIHTYIHVYICIFFSSLPNEYECTLLGNMSIR